MDQEKTQAQSKQEQIAKVLEKAKKDGEIKMEEVSSILQEIGADAAREDAFFEELENSGVSIITDSIDEGTDLLELEPD